MKIWLSEIKVKFQAEFDYTKSDPGLGVKYFKYSNYVRRRHTRDFIQDQLFYQSMPITIALASVFVLKRL